jgi:hypothetical protein
MNLCGCCVQDTVVAVLVEQASQITTYEKDRHRQSSVARNHRRSFLWAFLPQRSSLHSISAGLLDNANAA